MHEPAPAWRRLIARGLDLLFALPLTFLMIIPVVIVMLPVVLILGATDSDVAAGIGAGLAYALAYVCFEWLLLVRRAGQTLGKGLMGLRVVPADAPAGASGLGSGPALVRLAILLTPFVLLGVAGDDSGPDDVWDVLAYIGLASLVLSLTLAALPMSRRSLHDLAAGSRVVMAPKRRVDLRKDLRMALPVPQVNLTKDPAGRH